MRAAEAGAEQRMTPSATVTGTQSGTAADAKGAGASTDAVVEDLDMYLSTAATITEEEAMEEGSASGQQKEGPMPSTSGNETYSAAVTKSPPKVARKDTGRKVLEALDGHFHLDRMMGKSAKVSEMIQMPLRQAPDPQTVDVPGFVAAIGVHSRYVLSWNAPQKEAFKILVRSPNTKALGEIGLDFTAKGIEKQEEVLQYLLRGFADTANPVILHLRGRKGHEDEAYNRGLNLADACLPREQPIQLHCFSGGADVVARWQRQFPNSYMSFSGLVDSFNKHQKRGLKAVPANRLLLETDSPYLTLNSYIKGRVNTLHARVSGETGASVSGARDGECQPSRPVSSVGPCQGHAGCDYDVTSGMTRLGRRESSVLVQPPKRTADNLISTVGKTLSLL
ncbi:3'-5' ssDNA/RNA exonuclease tatd [Plakobranchus ocellatus]|uniref:3'-5' ssDNA/RNA exonuclease tatd n=1 Tax=Plakobranchus ocellatus TaxID=259542 RepID=A0AAV3ZJA5_9GAST|nr:3'-5' ssDNA/RNA exonuclease tatd [Plakobranchus ocellatus]